MKLLRMTIKNFKGIKEVEIDFQGKDTAIIAKNGVGKTSVYDAFLWAQCGKDSQGLTKFEVSPLGADGKVIKGRDTEVTLTMETDEGVKIELKKTLTPKWKRIDDVEVYNGDTTEHFFDGIPLKKTEYDAKIASLYPEAVMKLITNPMYFPSLKEEAQRELATGLIPEVPNADVMKVNPVFIKLETLLANKTTKEVEKALMAHKKDFEAKLTKMSARIEEAMRGAEGLDESAFAEFEKERERLNAEKSALSAKGNKGKEQLEASRKVKEMALESLKAEMRVLIAKEQEAEERYQAELREYKGLASKSDELTFAVQKFQSALDSAYSELKQAEAEVVALRAEFQDVKSEEFKLTTNDANCPTCGQHLPTDQADEFIANLRDKFATDRQNRINGINARGKVKAELVKTLKANIEEIEMDKAEKISELANVTERLSSSVAPSEPETSTQRKALSDKIQKAEEALLSVQVNTADDEMQKINDQIYELNLKLSKRDAVEEAKTRVAELEAEEKTIARELANVEGMIAVLGKFTAEKSRMQEANLNALFTKIKFKLFERTLDGKENECFKSLVNGVPFNTNVNTGAQINAGIEIINKFSEHYGVTAPLFIDHAESITERQESNSQMIYLVAKKGVDKLEVKYLEV